MLYICPRCLYTSKRTNDIKRHLKKKNECPEFCIPISREKLLVKFNIVIKLSLELFNSKNNLEPKEMPKEIMNKWNLLNNKQWKCPHKLCDKEYSHQSGLSRHLKDCDYEKETKEQNTNETTKITRIYLSKERRYEIFTGQNKICGICEDKIVANNFQIDHLVPVTAGGTNDSLNLLCVCPNCHSLKTKTVDKNIKALNKKSPETEYSRNILIHYIKETIIFAETY